MLVPTTGCIRRWEVELYAPTTRACTRNADRSTHDVRIRQIYVDIIPMPLSDVDQAQE